MERSDWVLIKFPKRFASNPIEKGIADQYSDGGPFDVNLQTTDGKCVSAHRFVMAMFSTVWSNVFRNMGPEGVFVMPIGLPHHIAKKLIELLYFREIQVLRDEKQPLLDAVKELGISGVSEVSAHRSKVTFIPAKRCQRSQSEWAPSSPVISASVHRSVAPVRPANVNGGRVQTRLNRQSLLPPPSAQMVSQNGRQLTKSPAPTMPNQLQKFPQIQTTKINRALSPAIAPAVQPTQAPSNIAGVQVPAGVSITMKPSNNQQMQQQQEQPISRTNQAQPDGQNQQVDKIGDILIDMNINEAIGNSKANDKEVGDIQESVNAGNGNMSKLPHATQNDGGSNGTMNDINANDGDFKTPMPVPAHRSNVLFMPAKRRQRLYSQWATLSPYASNEVDKIEDPVDKDNEFHAFDKNDM